MNNLLLYRRFIVTYLKSKTEYGIYYFMDFIINIIASLFGVVIIWVLLEKFNSIKGWDFYQVLFLYNINYFSYGFAAMFVWNPARQLGDMVRDGSFDGMMTKPLHPLLHMICRQFSHGHMIGCAFGVGVFVVCFAHLDINWTFINILWFLLTLLGAILIQASLLLLVGATSFWFVKSSTFFDVFINELRGFLNYPMSIYDKWVQILLTFVIPYAFVSFIPASAFLHKGGSGFGMPAAPVLGIVLVLAACAVWNIGINKYQGTGS